ncbi:MAG: MFS transporter [Planctomycetota bacterium]|nr:MAG: MFS transporter [Planctomycetota bacterium]
MAEVSTQSGSVAALDTETGAARAVATLGLMLFLSMVPVTLLVAPLKELVGVRYGAGSFWTHSFMSINMVGAILASPLIALLSDSGAVRRRVASVALAADAVLLSAMNVAPSLKWLLLLRFFEGAAHILAISTLMAIAAGWATDSRRGRTMGIVGSAMMLGTACGTRLGGEVWKHLPGSVFLVSGLISVAASAVVLFLVREAPGTDRPRRSIRDVAALLRTRGALLVAYAYAFVDRFCVGVVVSTLVLFFADVHGLEPAARGRLLVLFLVPFALLVYPAGRLADRIGRAWPLAAGSALFGVVFGAYGYASTEAMALLMVLSGVVSAVMFAPNLALCADLAPAEGRGAAFTGFNIAGSVGFLLGPLAGGLFYAAAARHMAEASAYRLTFLATGATEVLCAAVTLPFLLRLRRRGMTR